MLPRTPIELATSDAHPVPLLIGHDREEDVAFEFGQVPEVFTNRDWIRETNNVLGPRLAARARPLYPADEYESLRWAYMTMVTDAKRGCPTRRLANAVATRTPVYRWLYAHVFENDPFLAQFKASHAFEEPFIWSDFAPLLYTPTAAELRLSARMNGYWANFAKSGNPNGPGLPAWPRYDGAERTLVLDNQITVTRRYQEEQCALLDTARELFPGDF